MRTHPGTHESADTHRRHAKSPCGHAHALCMTPRPQAQPHGWTHPARCPSWMHTPARLPAPIPSRACAHRPTGGSRAFARALLHRECSDACMSGVPLHTGPTLSVQGLLAWGVFRSPHQSRRRRPPYPLPRLTGAPPDSVSCVPDGHEGHCPPRSPVDLFTVPEASEERPAPPSDCHAL